MKELVADLAQRYQIILLDTPPVLSVADATLLAPVVDWTILVLRAETTVTEEAMRAKMMLGTAKRKVLGSVLNSLDSQLAPGYHTYASYYIHPSGER